jgi:hypothetical protein
MTPLKGENSSYALTFKGPLIQCSSPTPAKFTISDEGPDGNNVVVYNGTWPHLDILDNQPVFSLTQRRVAGFYPAPSWLESTCYHSGSCVELSYPSFNRSVTMVFEQQTLQCEAYTTTYSVNISYIKGIQRIEYTTENAERLQHEFQLSFSWNTTDNSTMPTDTEKYKMWESRIPSWKEKANSRAILDSVGYNLGYQWSQTFIRSLENTTQTYLLPNGTETALGRMHGFPPESFSSNPSNSKSREVLCRANTNNLPIRLQDPTRQRTQPRPLWTQCILQFRPARFAQHHRSLNQRTPRQRFHFRPLSEQMVRQRQRHRPRLPERIPLLAPTEPARAVRVVPLLHSPLHLAGAECAAAQRDLSHRRRLPADHDDDDGRYGDEPQCAGRLFGRQW